MNPQGVLSLDRPAGAGFVFRGLEHYRNPPSPLAFAVSGGRSSAFAAWHFIEANGGAPDGVIFNFENTGRERSETLDFVDRLDRHLGLGIHWLEFDPAAKGKVRRVTYETASRNGEPFDKLLSEIVPLRRDGSAGVRPLPNPAQRVCTATLKIKTLHRYVRKHLGWPTDYSSAIGYRADEKLRYERRMRLDARKSGLEGGRGWFPLYHSGARAEDVESFWLGAPFDLQQDVDWNNCDYCFHASEWRLKQRMVLEAIECQMPIRPGAAPPPRLARWIADEERQSDRPGPYRLDRPTYRQMWEQVCAGNLGGAVPDERCGTCTD